MEGARTERPFHVYLFGYVVIAIVHLLHEHIPDYELTLGGVYALMFAVSLLPGRAAPTHGPPLHLFGYPIVAAIHVLYKRMRHPERALGLTYMLMFAIAAGVAMAARAGERP